MHMLTPYWTLSPSHADIYTRHCHTAYSYCILVNTHTPTCRLLAQLLLLATPCAYHSNRNKSYGFAFPTNTSSLLLSLEKNIIFLYPFFFSYPHQKLPMCTINLSSFPSGCLIRRLIDTSFFPSATETCEISRSM